MNLIAVRCQIIGLVDKDALFSAPNGYFIGAINDLFHSFADKKLDSKIMIFKMPRVNQHPFDNGSVIGMQPFDE